jgi:hypothetical protein
MQRNDKYTHMAREFRALIKNEGELGMAKCIITLAEDNIILKQQLGDLVATVQMLFSILKDHNTVQAMLGQQMQKLESKYHPNSEANPDHNGV